MAQLYLASLYLLLPLMPLLATILFVRIKYVLEYRGTLRKLTVHIAALREGPAQHYLHDVLGLGFDVPREIHGECVCSVAIAAWIVVASFMRPLITINSNAASSTLRFASSLIVDPFPSISGI